MKKEIKIAVVGAGYWGKNLVRAFYELGCLSVVCDSNIEILSDLKKKYPDLETTTDFTEILNNEKVNGIVISLPAEVHYEFSKKAILSGKNVFVEKPLALNCKDGEELVSLFKEKKRILMVGKKLTDKTDRNYFL